MFNVPQGVQSAATGAGAAVKKGVQAVQQGPVGQAVGQAGQAVGQAAASVGNRASQFLSSVTTPPSGAPSWGGVAAAGVAGLGAGAAIGSAVANQQNKKGRMAGDAIQIGSPHVQGAVMPQDLQTGYLNLNTFGSPLPQYGVLASHNLRAAQINQDQGTAYHQQMMTGYMQQTGQLPVGTMPPQPQRKGRR